MAIISAAISGSIVTVAPIALAAVNFFEIYTHAARAAIPRPTPMIARWVLGRILIPLGCPSGRKRHWRADPVLRPYR